MEWIQDGGFLSARGFRVGAARCGIKTAESEPDLALLVSDGPARAAGVFTTNRFAAAPVLWCREHLPSEAVRAVVVNSGCANAATGEQGRRDAQATAETAAELLSCRADQVLVASTGVIGHCLQMDRIKDGLKAAKGPLSTDMTAAREVERAIMTTDTRPKACAVRSRIGDTPFHVGGMAKGAGMIAPHMATMLCFVATDAEVPCEVLDRTLREAANCTLNCATVDGDTSTNDTCIVLASGASGARVEADGEGLEKFREALQAVLGELAREIVSDGEGATKLIVVRALGGVDDADARRAARAIAESSLVKCAVRGEDPNWGRIACAAGYSGAEVVPEKVTIAIGDVTVLECGRPTGRDAAAQMKGDEVILTVDLGLGSGSARMLTCDLTEEYVRINADYHT